MSDSDRIPARSITPPTTTGAKIDGKILSGRRNTHVWCQILRIKMPEGFWHLKARSEPAYAFIIYEINRFAGLSYTISYLERHFSQKVDKSVMYLCCILGFFTEEKPWDFPLTSFLPPWIYCKFN